MKKSFTLIELLVVIIILGSLSALIFGNFFTSLKKGRDARRKADLEQIQKALEMYYEDNRQYPDNLSFGEELSFNGKVYMKKVPNDPVASRRYKYVYDSINNGYQLYACLENTEQILPNQEPLQPAGGFNCPTNCFASDGQTKITCIWGVSSSNLSP